MQTAIISASGAGDNSIVAATPGKRIRVLGFVLSFSGATNAKWRDGTTDLTGLLYGAADGSITAPVTPSVMASGIGWFKTSQGNALQLNLSLAVAVGGWIVYDLVS